MPAKTRFVLLNKKQLTARIIFGILEIEIDLKDLINLNFMASMNENQILKFLIKINPY